MVYYASLEAFTVARRSAPSLSRDSQAVCLLLVASHESQHAWDHADPNRNGQDS